MVRLRRLELPRVLPHSDLNAARLPIPPQPHIQYHFQSEVRYDIFPKKAIRYINGTNDRMEAREKSHRLQNCGGDDVFTC